MVRWNASESACRSRSTPTAPNTANALQSFLGDLACEPASGAPYVPVASSIGSARFGRRSATNSTRCAGDRRPGARTRETRPGVAGFTDGDWRRLEAIKPD